MTSDAEARNAHGLRGRIRPYTTTSGMLLAGACAPIGFVDGMLGPEPRAPSWVQVSACATAVLLLVAALTILRRPRAGRILATVGIVSGFALAAPKLFAAPALALAVMLVGTAALVLLWKIGAPLIELSRVGRRPVREGQAQGAAMMAFALWLPSLLAAPEHPLDELASVAWGVLWAVAFAMAWATRGFACHRGRSIAIFVATAIAMISAYAFRGEAWRLMSAFMLPTTVAVTVIRRSPRRAMGETGWWDLLLGHPERLLVGTFAGLCFVGTVLLTLPQSSASGQSIGFLHAAFTATSAVCVTGLIVLDTALDFSGFGQAVILMLIQVGGLGIMTFSTAIVWALGRRMSLRTESAFASILSAHDRGRLFASARRILQFTLAAELAGALALGALFSAHGDELPMAAWRGIFTSISAFCNAGFALQTDSLIPYRESPLILHTVGLLIILGGSSPMVAFALPILLRRGATPVSAQAKLALSATGLLLVVGFAFTLAFEWDASLHGLDVPTKLHNAWFQSVTLRTAGFNSIDLTALRPASLIAMLVWMFIGGCPGSTAGGVKTTTIAVLALSVLAAVRGQWTLEVFGKRVPERTRIRAIAVVGIAASTGMLALLVVLMTQSMPARDAVFEVVSALGTVGLTIGGTGALDEIGKTIIIMCMFIGRVGGLTLLMFLSSRRAINVLGRPEEDIDVG